MRISDWSSDVCSSDLGAAVSDVAGDLGKPAQGAGTVVLGSDDHTGPEAAAVLATAPAFFHVVTVTGGFVQRHIRVRRALLGQIEQRKMPAEDFLFAVTLDPFGACVPGNDMALGVQRKDSVEIG